MMRADLVVDWITTGLLHGTALAALTGLAAVTVLRRARPAVMAALWTVVLLKFLVPIGPRTPLSLSSALDHAIARAAGAGGDGGAAAAAPGGAIAAVEGAAAGAGWSALVGWALVAAYAAGLALLVARRSVRHRGLIRRVRALPAASPDSVDRLRQLAHRLGRAAPGRLPDLRVSRDAASPYLVGVLRPLLVVPGWLDPSSPAWAAAMTHELAHLARRDPWLRGLESAASALFFFWPPVAWVCRRIDRAREMACDQWAVTHGPLPARDYARLLLALATRARDRSLAAAGAIALVRTRSQLGARVDQLLAGLRPPTVGRARGALVAAWAVVCLAGAARATRAAAPEAAECTLEPELMAQILATHPAADADGDGLLSQDEACAHQQRMRQRLLDRVVDADMASRLDPDADADGDGQLSDVEIAAIKDQFELEMAPDSGDEVLLHYGGAPVPLPAEQVRVSAAVASARVCRAAPCADGAAPGSPARGRFPLLIDVTLPTQE